MKTPLLFASLLLCITQFSFAQEVQPDTIKISPANIPPLLGRVTDVSYAPPTPRDGFIDYGPAFGKNKINDLGYYAATVNSPQLFHLSAGVSVINTLRGQTTGISISPQAMDATMSTRGSGTLFVIDGLPSNAISDHYNLNALEYQSISVINSGNAAIRYGGAGLNSVVLLQRKNGAGVEGPSFEANSYTTFASNRMPDSFSEEETPVERWMFTNAVAYAQDFGAVDTRVSYAYSRFPSNNDYPVLGNVHATSINTGLELGDRFKARLILDQFARLNSMDETSTYSNAKTHSEYSGKETFLQGNLSMSYDLAKGIQLSSQAAWSRVKDRLALSSLNTTAMGNSAGYNREYEHQQRTFINLFLNGIDDLNKGWNLHYGIGYQVERFDPYRDAISAQISGEYWTKSGSTIGFDITTKSTIAEAGFNKGDFLSFAANYQHNDFPEAHNDAYTFASSFTFSEAFQWKGNVFSFGNIRANYGKADLMNNVTFPIAFTSDLFQTGQLRVGGSKFETGADFGFLNNKITLTANRFYNVNDNTYFWVLVPNGSNFSNHILIDVGETDIKGWELMAGAKIVDKTKFRWTAKINWRTSKTVIKQNYFASSDLEVSPGWESGILNQFEIKHWFVSFLIDTHHDADYMVLDHITGGMPVYRWDEVSQTKLRDLSVGYSFPKINTNGTLIRVSLSGRNLWTIHSTADSDFENTMGTYTTMKNFSVSIGATF